MFPIKLILWESVVITIIPVRHDSKKRTERTRHVSAGEWEGKTKKDRTDSAISFPKQCFKRPLQQTSKAAWTRTQALPQLPAEHLCVKMERQSVKYTLGNSLNCRHLMEHLLEKDYTGEQMRFCFSSTQKHSLSTCKSNSTRLNGFSFQQSACCFLYSHFRHNVTDVLFYRSACSLPRCISGVTK